MENNARSYTAGLKDYLTRVLGKDVVMEDITNPHLNFGIESVVHVKSAESGADFYAGFDVQSRRASSRVRFFLQLASPKNVDFMKRLSEGTSTKRRVSKNLGETTERFNPEANAYCVYSHVTNPDHTKPEDLYSDLVNYFLRGNVSIK